MVKILIASVVLAAGLASTAAQARGGNDVYWSVGINAPINGYGSVGTVVGNYPGPAPVVVQPAPVYYPQPVVVYRRPPPPPPPPPVVYYPAPVVVESYPGYGYGHYRHRHHHHRHWR